MQSSLKTVLLAGVSLAVGATAAIAGGVAIREQSALGMGNAFAGAAAGGAGLGSMFWNPATMTDHEGWNSSWNFSGLLPYNNITPGAGTSPALLTPILGSGAPSGNIGKAAVVPATYTSYQFNDKLWFGLAVTAPFGSATKSPTNWAGAIYGQTSKLTTIDINPNIAYKINDMVSVSVGVRAMYAFLHYTRAGTVLAANTSVGISKADAWGWGFTAGLTIKPAEGTEIGIGYRSQVKEKISGTLITVGSTPITSTITAPDQVTVGVKQKVNDQWTVLAGLEWTNWSVFNNFPVFNSSTGAAIPSANFDFRWSNGWFASVGAEYKYNQDLTLRGGFAYEWSPISDTVRGVRIPDNDRIWLTAGLSYQLSNKLSIDASYAHIFIKNAPIAINNANNPAFVAPLAFVGTSKGHVDIVSVGVNYRWSEPARAVVAKY